MTTQTEKSIEHYEMSLLDVERSTIDIDGTPYTLADPDDYGVPTLREVDRKWKLLNTWDQADKLSEVQGREYDTHLNWLVTIACPDLPNEIINHKNFKRSQKTSIVLAFFIEAAKRHPLLKKNNGLEELLQNSTDSMVEASQS